MFLKIEDICHSVDYSLIEIKKNYFENPFFFVFKLILFEENIHKISNVRTVWQVICFAKI